MSADYNHRTASLWGSAIAGLGSEGLMALVLLPWLVLAIVVLATVQFLAWLFRSSEQDANVE